jgi:hypothetical protein
MEPAEYEVKVSAYLGAVGDFWVLDVVFGFGLISARKVGSVTFHQSLSLMA